MEEENANCANCHFSTGHVEGHPDAFNCRRRAPIIDHTKPLGPAQWPLVKADDWCGEYLSENAG